MPIVYGALDIVKNELRNAVMQNLGTAPAAPVKGLMYFNSADNTFYWYDGTAWIAAKAAAGAIPASTVTTQAIGDTGTVGVGTNYARDDHKHGMPAFGTTVEEIGFGQLGTPGSAVTTARSDHRHGNPTHVAADHSTIPISALAAATANINMNSFAINNLNMGAGGLDAVNKAYVDNLIMGLSWKDTVRCATTTNITRSGLLTIDGITVASGDRVLVKNQTAPAENGIFTASASGWGRTADADWETELLNAAVFVSTGTVNADTAWVMTTNAPITIDTTGLVWAQFGAGAVYVAGLGLTLTGNTFDVGAGTGITVAADTVAVDTTVIATQAYVTSALVGTAKRAVQSLAGTSSPEIVTHNLNTRDIMLSVYNGASPYTAVQVDWDSTTLNTATVRYNPNLGVGYRCVVIGAG